MKGKTKKIKLEGKMVFCCLAGEKYGLGHVQRCLKLARRANKELKKLKIEFIIFPNSTDSAKKELVKEKIASEFPVHFTDNLGSGLKKSIDALKPKVVLIDMLSLKLDFLSPRDYRVISLDNYLEGADVYVNILKSKSGNLKNEHSGYKYWIIEPPKKELTKRKNKISKIKRILISCGYSDPKELTEVILKGITGYYNKSKSTIFPDITCVITSLFKKGVEARLQRINKRIVIKKDILNLEKEIVKSDLCIVCGGNTMFESITLTTPTVVVSCEPRNYELSKELEKAGYVKVLEKSKLEDEIAVHKFFKMLNPDLLNNLHDKCLEYDGYGIEKIMNLIEKELEAEPEAKMKEKKYLMIIGGSYEQELVIRKAKEMGYSTIVIDINPEAPGYKIADVKEQINTTDAPAIIKVAKKYKIKGVLTNSSESAIISVAKVAKALGLPGTPLDVADNTTDKELMKKAFIRDNLPTADFFTVRNEKQALDAADKLGYPCIIKPADNAGSRGVLRIDSPGEVKQAFNYAMPFSKKKKCLVEKFIEGLEMSADALSYNGQTEVLVISDKEKQADTKNNVAMNIVYPPRFSDEEVNNAKELIKAAVKAVGIRNGPSHTEIIRRGFNDFVILEIGSRGGGFWTFSKVVPAICGIDTMEQIINLAVGKPIEITPKYSRAAVLRFTTGKPGRITRLGDIEKAKKTSGVIHVGYFLKKGDVVKKLEKDGDRVGYMILKANTREEVVALSDKIVQLLKVQTEPIKNKKIIKR